mgnify:CR=1 FL=1|jgi:hypothetical protein
MANTALLPERHMEREFFAADIVSALPFKDDRHTMEFPFFTLSTKKDLRTIEYYQDNVSIVVSPSIKHGLPTVLDKDILLYCSSIVMAEINKGNTPPKVLRVSSHDLMQTTNRESNGKGYALLKKALDRLSSVHISTNIKTNGFEEREAFHIIDYWRCIESSRIKDRMIRLEISLSDWYYRALLGHEVLTIHPDYFRLRKSSERRLYEIARKHCGQQKRWDISLEKLHCKSGSQSELFKFRALTKTIIETNQTHNHFPDYDIELCPEKDIVTFTPKGKRQLENELPVSVQDGNQPILSKIRIATLDKAREITRNRGTGWDFDVVMTQFCDFVRTKEAMGETVKTMNGAFLGFVKHVTKKCP